MAQDKTRGSINSDLLLFRVSVVWLVILVVLLGYFIYAT
jgi:hypothetical protein